MYFEAHVTVEPVFEDRLKGLRLICDGYGFRVAELLMQKRKTDLPERSKYDTFTTGRSKDYEDLAVRTEGLVRNLKDLGYKVYRYKIEKAVVDSKLVDEFALLGE